MEKEQLPVFIIAIIAVVAIVLMTLGAGVNGLAAGGRQPPIPIQLNILFDDGAVPHAGAVLADAQPTLKVSASTNMDRAIRSVEFLAWHRETGCIREIGTVQSLPFEVDWDLQQLDCGRGVYHIITTVTHASKTEVSRRAAIVIE